MAANRPPLTPQSFISGALEANPDEYADQWGEELQQRLEQEVRGGGEGFLAEVLRLLSEEAKGTGTAIAGAAGDLYRTSSERATAGVHAVLGVLNAAARRRPKMGTMLVALVQRFRDLLKMLAIEQKQRASPSESVVLSLRSAFR